MILGYLGCWVLLRIVIMIVITIQGTTRTTECSNQSIVYKLNGLEYKAAVYKLFNILQYLRWSVLSYHIATLNYLCTDSVKF